jgi:hypothetical protein
MATSGLLRQDHELHQVEILGAAGTLERKVEIIFGVAHGWPVASEQLERPASGGWDSSPLRVAYTMRPGSHEVRSELTRIRGRVSA